MTANILHIVNPAPDETLVSLCESVQQTSDIQLGRGYRTTACAVVKDGVGFVALNRMPKPIEAEYSSTPRGAERAPKFVAVGHAEQNAIAHCAKIGLPTKGAVMVLAWFPCLTCAAMIAEAGFSKVVCRRPDYDYKASQYDFLGAETVLRGAGVEIVFIGDEVIN